MGVLFVHFPRSPKSHCACPDANYQVTVQSVLFHSPSTVMAYGLLQWSAGQLVFDSDFSYVKGTRVTEHHQ